MDSVQLTTILNPAILIAAGWVRLMCTLLRCCRATAEGLSRPAGRRADAPGRCRLACRDDGAAESGYSPSCSQGYAAPAQAHAKIGWVVRPEWNVRRASLGG